MSNPGYENFARGLHQTQMPGQQGQPMQPMQGLQRMGMPVQAGQGYSGMQMPQQMPPMQTQAARFQQYQPPPSSAFQPTQQYVQRYAQDKAAALQQAQQAQDAPTQDLSGRNG